MPASRRRSASANAATVVSFRSFLLAALLSRGVYSIEASSFRESSSGRIRRFHVRKLLLPSNLGTLLWTTVVLDILANLMQGDAYPVKKVRFHAGSLRF